MRDVFTLGYTEFGAFMQCPGGIVEQAFWNLGLQLSKDTARMEIQFQEFPACMCKRQVGIQV